MRKFIIAVLILSFYILHSTFYISSALALDSTPSADIKAKLEELKAEIASKAAKLKQEVNKKLQNKAYIGKVKTKTDSSLTIATRTGPKIVTINQDTLFENRTKTKQKFSLKTLAEDDFVASLGDIDETQVLIAKKIVLLSPVTSNLKTYSWGQIVGISDKLLTLKDKNLKNIALTLPASSVKLNDFVILTGSFNKNEIFEAEFVFVSQGGILKSKKMATPSAQVASKSASPSAKKK